MDNEVSYTGDLWELHQREFIGFHPNEERFVTLRGDFTTTELRRIADTIDAIMDNQRKENEGI